MICTAHPILFGW